MARELDAHLQELVEANLASGMAPAEARRQAILAFGRHDQLMQQLREVHTARWLEALGGNVRAALRLARRFPSFSATVVLTLALGIGANSAVFSAVDAVLLRPLPFPHSEELVAIQQSDLATSNPEHQVAPVRLEDWNARNTTFQAISGYYIANVTETSGEEPERLVDATVAARFLEVWGLTPELGRGFLPAEEHFGGPPVLLITDRLWRRRYGADPAVLGKVMRLDGHPGTIVGVLPPSFHLGEVDILDPNPYGGPWTLSRDSAWFRVQGRMKPGVTPAGAQADLARVQRELGRQFPQSDGHLSVQVKPLKQEIVGDAGKSLSLLYGSVSLLLLIACINIGALLLTRATEREHEVAIRFSLGASRLAVLSQMLTETLLLALAGSALGLGVAAAASRFFAAYVKDLPRVEEITLGGRTLAYALACALLTTLLSALLPALRATRRRGLLHSLGRTARTQVGTRSTAHWVLVGAQVALAVTLLTGAGLLLRSLAAMQRVYPGFESTHVLSLHISGSWAETANPAQLATRIERTLDALRSLPGVEDAATSSFAPGVEVNYHQEFKLVEAAQNPTRKIMADPRYVSSSYFRTMKIPVLAGRACREALQFGTVMVNQSFARAYFPRGGAVGSHLLAADARPGTPPFTIDGIAGDAKEQGLNHPPAPTLYWCIAAPTPDPFYLVRVHGDPAAMAGTLRRALHKFEPTRSVYALAPLDEQLSEAFAENRLRTLLLSVFALTAVALVSLGLYGTVSYLGRLSRREIGLRIALGAMPGQIVWRFLAQSLRVAGAAGLAGVALGLGTGQLLRGMLYGVASSDPATFAGALLLVLAVASVASLLPAIRAASVEPTSALREE